MQKKKLDLSGIDALIIGIVWLTILLLRGFNVIQWPWVWILAPLWVVPLCGFIVLAIALFGVVIKEKIEKRRRSKCEK